MGVFILYFMKSKKYFQCTFFCVPEGGVSVEARDGEILGGEAVAERDC